MPQWLPFDSFFSRKNKLMCASLFAAAVPSLLRIVGRLYYDIFFFGMPAGTADTLWMIFYYVADIALVLIGYLIIILLLNRIEARENQRKKVYQQSFQ